MLEDEHRSSMGEESFSDTMLCKYYVAKSFESSSEFWYYSCILSLFRLKYNSSYLSILPFESITFSFHFALEALFLIQTKASLILVSIALLNPIVLWSFFA
jgi:hypothetical protein